MGKENDIWLTVDGGATLLGVSKRTIQRNMKAKKYTTKTVTGNGGQQYRILLSSLPQDSQDFYFAKKTKELVTENKLINASQVAEQEQQKTDERMKIRQQGLMAFSALSASKKAQAKQKQKLVHACQQYIRENALKKVAGIQAFCNELNAGELVLHPKVMAVIPVHHGIQNLNPGSFKRWLFEYESKGMIALVNHQGKRAGQSKIDSNEALKRFVVGFILSYPHAGGKKIKEALAAQDEALDIVSQRSIERYIEQWKQANAQIWTYITYPDKWKNVYMSAQGSHFEDVTGLNSLWEMDSTPGDWLLKDGRHSVIACIDMYSRRLTFYVSKSSSAEAVCRCFRKAAINWGLPERVRTDNGKDYVSDHFMDVLRDLEIQQDLCIPFASEEKGTIERHIGTMLHGLLELLPGFCGHNVAQAQQIRSMKSFAERIMTPGEVVEVDMSSSDLQAAVDKWAHYIYAQEPHSGLKGKTPAQMASLYSGHVNRISNERALDVLLAEPAGTRTISKKGLRFNNYDYINADLTDYIGKQAILKYDEQDAGRLFVYIEGQFICIAESPDLTDISRQEVAIVAKKAQKRKQNEQAKELKDYKKDIAKNIPELVMNYRIENAENVMPFPRPGVEHNTPALEQAATAERVLTGVADEVIHTPEEIKEKANVIEFLSSKPEVNILAMNDSEKFRYWQGLDEMLKEGDSLSEKEKNFYDRFQKTDTFRVISETLDDLAVKVEK